uniref:Uncharacterized protein n=1 Tax=Anguilla anguilla TaxID=7936 RepID=A0A0E9WSS0_ANGAN
MFFFSFTEFFFRLFWFSCHFWQYIENIKDSVVTFFVGMEPMDMVLVLLQSWTHFNCTLRPLGIIFMSLPVQS